MTIPITICAWEFAPDVLLGVYAAVLLYVLRQKAFYFGLLRTVLKRPHSSAAARDPA